MDCSGDYLVVGVTLDGEWGFPGYGDDSAGCPVPLVPGTFLLEYPLPKNDSLVTSPDINTCQRIQTFYGPRCDSIYVDKLSYNRFGFTSRITKSRLTIWAREWAETRIYVRLSRVVESSVLVNRITLAVENRWMVDLLQKACEHTTVGGYTTGGLGALDIPAAEAAELYAYCNPFTPPEAWSEGNQFDADHGWSNCVRFGVTRTMYWQQDFPIGSSCSPVCASLGIPYLIKGDRILFSNGYPGPSPTFFPRCGTTPESDTYPPWWEKNPDGTTPLAGDYGTQVASIPPATPGFGELTGPIRGQIIESLYGGIDIDFSSPDGTNTSHSRQFREPIWPLIPTATLLCDTDFLVSPIVEAMEGIMHPPTDLSSTLTEMLASEGT